MWFTMKCVAGGFASLMSISYEYKLNSLLFLVNNLLLAFIHAMYQCISPSQPDQCAILD